MDGRPNLRNKAPYLIKCGRAVWTRSVINLHTVTPKRWRGNHRLSEIYGEESI